MNYLWDSESFVDENTLSVNIKRLRDKMEEINLKSLIETKRGQGYILKWVFKIFLKKNFIFSKYYFFTNYNSNFFDAV